MGNKGCPKWKLEGIAPCTTALLTEASSPGLGSSILVLGRALSGTTTGGVAGKGTPEPGCPPPCCIIAVAAMGLLKGRIPSTSLHIRVKDSFGLSC
jgi:hypothetical protein